MTAGQFLFWAVVYIVAVRACLIWLHGTARMVVFALVNVLGVWRLVYPEKFLFNPFHIVVFGGYVALVTVQYLMLARFADKKGKWPWLAFFTPLVALVAIKYLPAALGPLWKILGTRPAAGLEIYYFIGISYLAFRASQLVLDVRNGAVPKPGYWEYLGFCFFVPTMTVGPINTYGLFARGFSGPNREELPLGRCLLRVLVGLVKFIPLAHLCDQLSYQGLVFDGHPHHWIDLFVAGIFYYLFLYCNFSGFCDIAIGVAGLLGFPVEENFRDPFAARNIQEFWNRWHITLSRYMRDVAFTPLSKWLIGVLGVSRANAAIALSVFVVFVVVGVWHGVGWNYVVFGAIHGLGLVIVFYYGIAMKKWLGKERYKWYLQNRWIHLGAIIVTFLYVAASLFFFANNFAAIRKIWSLMV